LWLLTNDTLCPAEIVTVAGLTEPFAPMVIVAPTGPGLPDTGLDGDVGELPPPPQATSGASRAASTTPPIRFDTPTITSEKRSRSPAVAGR
jgi:hypothetical protein